MTIPNEPRQPTRAETDAAADDFRAMQRKRGVQLRCPSCGADSWSAIGDVGVHVLEGRNPKTGEIARIPGSVHCVGLTCDKCGLLSLFDRDVIGG